MLHQEFENLRPFPGCINNLLLAFFDFLLCCILQDEVYHYNCSTISYFFQDIKVIIIMSVPIPVFHRIITCVAIAMSS
eukprot:10544.XXX_295741_295974_1 [CDS] Oithona nana genome sequencing.